MAKRKQNLGYKHRKKNETEKSEGEVAKEKYRAKVIEMKESGELNGIIQNRLNEVLDPNFDWAVDMQKMEEHFGPDGMKHLMQEIMRIQEGEKIGIAK